MHTGLLCWRTENFLFDSRKDQEVCHFARMSDQLWSPYSLLCNEVPVTFSSMVKWQYYKIDSPPSSAEINSERSSTSNFQYIFIAWTWSNLTLLHAQSFSSSHFHSEFNIICYEMSVLEETAGRHIVTDSATSLHIKIRTQINVKLFCSVTLCDI
jgi:hypothetical protein